MFAKAKAGMLSAGDATARGAKRAKLHAEIVVLQSKVKDAKKDFGVKVYDSMYAANQAEVDRLFMELRTKVDALEGEIDAKRQMVANLKEPGSHLQQEETQPNPFGAPPQGATPPGAPQPAGPPLGLPPSASSALDRRRAGKATKTADGKEYYFNESTGESKLVNAAASDERS